MKLVRLQAQGFGPFVECQDIDFQSLEQAPLFLITGPTGAGKTTILDAICFALYGEASGRDRESRQMRSDFATTAQTTEVTLDFEMGDERYRVRRTPPYLRPRKRGSGAIEEP